ncbi:hypothetical protein [Hymenobacter jeollabukensis]|uniref:Lipoprotein n=1 Tax=Hymenobacter jeollabukensis TaxID=2025313 RepID=A0A5R8WJU9_9BACT|nr:hypothetical protein [Hymenobacter jeollabukensis]TLM89101.1 hypothetical protein FDY95_21260 [Hymenobacter jeollabukensis]
MVFSSRTGLALAVLALTACHQQPALQSRFAPTAPVTDGQATEWDNSQLQTDEHNHLQYQVTNDARTVYLRLKTGDQATQRRLIFQGLTVWLDTTGRHQQQFGVHFPLGGSMGAAIRQHVETANAGPASPADYQARLAQALANMHEMQLLKFKGNAEPTLAENHTQLGLHAAAAFDASGNLIYELAVPLRLLYKRGSSFAPDKKPVVGLTLVGGQRPVGSSSGGPGGMSGGQRGGGRRGGPGGPGGSGKNRGGSGSSGQTLSLKISAQLAAQ